jgi:hypothetical protein
VRRVLAVMLLGACTARAAAGEPPQAPPATDEVRCLDDGGGYFRARLAGAIDAEIDWGNEGTECSGGERPNGGGLRIAFGRTVDADGDKLVLLFAVPDLPEGKSARGIPVDITIIRQGTGEFYGTQGKDRCFLDELSQEPILGVPRRTRAYRVTGRGYCMQPARAVSGDGYILVSRFDYAGRIAIEDLDDDVPAAGPSPPPSDET